MSLLDLSLTPEAYDTVDVPFGEWLPDLAELNNPGAVEALNVLPVDGAYGPFPGHVAIGAPLGDVVRGAYGVVQPNDTTQIYAATLNGLFTRIGTNSAWSQIYSAGITVDNYWKFLRVNEQMVALHPSYQPVRSPIGTTTAATVLGGNPPTASCGAQVGDFLMLGDLRIDPDDSNGYFPSRIRWSGFNNIDLPWISDPATQADFQDMPPEGGPVVAISGREYGTIFQARMISRATYRGPPSIFDIATVEDKRGCIARDAVVDVGPYQFFIAEDGFYYWNGTNSTPIGNNKVNTYFFNRLSYANRARIVGAVDYVSGCVLWAFPTDASGALNEIIIYSYREDRWSHSIQTLEYLFTSASSNITAEDLTDPVESYAISFDSPFFRSGGRSRLAAFNTNHAYGLFTGSPLAATLDTGEFSGPSGRRVAVANARPLVDVAAPLMSVQAIGRDQFIGQPLSYGEIVPQEDDGTCPIIADARYLRFRAVIPANIAWKHASGVQIMRKTTGVF